MSDRREDILAQVLVILGGLGATSVARNRIDLSENARPALVLLDGEEASVPAQLSARGQHVPAAPLHMIMNPSVIILAPTAPPTNIGSTLNGYRAQVIKAVLGDPTLNDLVGTSVGAMRYLGSDRPEIERGRVIEGALSVNFAFDYLLKPAEL
jgi:hypothetical protein